MEKETISVTEVSRRIGRSTAAVQYALRNGTFPVGTAIRTESGEYAYIIPREAFERFMSGDTIPRDLLERIVIAFEKAARSEVLRGGVA